MKTFLSITLLGLILICLNSSCRKSSIGKDHDLYVLGYSKGPTVFYMKNQQRAELEDNNYTRYGAIFVDGNDVYIPYRGGYLKNGVKVTLPNAESVYQVKAFGGIVYACGLTADQKAAYWRNDEMVKLGPDSVAGSTFPGPLIVDGNDVYVAGTYYPPGSVNKVVYWKNGVLNIVADGSLYCMKISGRDIYIGGIAGISNTIVGVYWKNGIRRDVFDQNGNRPAGIFSIDTYNDDVYMVGGFSGPNLYWKNDQPVGGFGNQGTPHTIKVDNGNIYVMENVSYSVPGGTKKAVLLWKNGNADTLFEGYGMSLFIGSTLKEN